MLTNPVYLVIILLSLHR